MGARQCVRLVTCYSHWYSLCTFRLDGLPFTPEMFDLVRVVGLDMAVPEDEVRIHITPFLAPILLSSSFKHA